MKGISLSVTTVVIVILAVLVLVALFIFFSMGFAPGQGDILSTQTKASKCIDYAEGCPGCNCQAADEELAAICGGSDAAIIKECCSIYCSGSPVECTDLFAGMCMPQDTECAVPLPAGDASCGDEKCCEWQGF